MNSLDSTGLADLLARAKANQNTPQPAPSFNKAAVATRDTLPGLPGGGELHAAVPPGAIEIELSEPVSVANGVLVDVVYLRQPTFGDWLDCGDLMQTVAVEAETGTPKIQVSIDPQAAVKWFARLSGHNARFFRVLPLRDWRRILKQLQVLAGDAPAENPTT